MTSSAFVSWIICVTIRARRDGRTPRPSVPEVSYNPSAASHISLDNISCDCGDIDSTGYTDLSVGWERTRWKSAMALSGRLL